MSHSPIPWRFKWDKYAGYDAMSSGYVIYANTKNEFEVCTIDCSGDYQNGKLCSHEQNPTAAANAKLIVLAVNYHDRLVEALGLLTAWADSVPLSSERKEHVMSQARALLDEIKGEQK